MTDEYPMGDNIGKDPNSPASSDPDLDSHMSVILMVKVKGEFSNFNDINFLLKFIFMSAR